MSSEARIAGCTIVSPNYLPFARVLARSWREHHGAAPFFVLVVADLAPEFVLEGEPFEAVPVTAIGIATLRAEAMKYDILELNTNVKPAFLQYLFRRLPDVEQLVYLDPDIRIYAPLQPVWGAMDAGAAVVLTPHMTKPVWDGKSPGEQDLLYNGTYNLGFVGLRRSAEADAVLRWWSQRCLEAGFSEGRTGLFVDQKWMNLVPGMFEGVAILRDAGCNMAYWNLHERRLVDGFKVDSDGREAVPLRFFHFSGVAVDDGTVLSRNTDRFTLAGRPDLQGIFGEYGAAVRGARVAATDGVPYGFDRLTDGTVVTRLARRVFAGREGEFGGDPFDAQGPFATFARRAGLLAGKEAAAKQTWREFKGEDRRVVWVHRLLRGALRVLGPNRYELLMRYLGHISVLRNQAELLRAGRDAAGAGSAAAGRR